MAPEVAKNSVYGAREGERVLEEHVGELLRGHAIVKTVSGLLGN